MKEVPTDYEQYLIYAKIAGSLSEEEEHLCDALLRTNPLALETYQQLLLKLPAGDVATSFNRFKDPAKWPLLPLTDNGARTPVIKKRGTVHRLLPAVAAAVVLALIGMWWLWNSQREHQSPQVAQQQSKSIQLTLADGKQIDLSQVKGTISGDKARLTNSGTALHYSVSSPGATGMNRLVVPTGMDYQVTLSDSTRVWLNAATRLDFPFAFTGDTREITITGEAYLEVAKSTKPFIVHLPHSTVQVLGTRFNVNSYDQTTEQVSLVEGAVRMKAGDQELELKPGRAGAFRQGAGLQETAFDQEKVLAWRQGLFYFKNATVAEISLVIPRWYGMETEVDNPALLPRRFTGAVDKNQPIQIFQNNLKAISGVDSYIDANGVLHFK